MREKLPSLHTAVDIAYDETEMQVSTKWRLKSFVQTRRGQQHMVMLNLVRSIMIVHAAISMLYPDGTQSVEQFAAAPCVLSDITAETLHAAMNDRMKEPLALLEGSSEYHTLILTSDAATSCCAVHNMYRHSVVTGLFKYWLLSTMCSMHQLSLAINAGFKLTKIIGALLCIVTLMHRAGVHDAVMVNLRAHVTKNLQITDTPPTAEHVKNCKSPSLTS